MKMEQQFVILQKYVHSDLHNDNKCVSKDNLGNVRMVWDVYNDDVVSVCGKDQISDIEDNINNFKMIWEVYNDDVDVVSMSGKDQFRVDDFEDDVYVVINDSVNSYHYVTTMYCSIQYESQIIFYDT